MTSFVSKYCEDKTVLKGIKKGNGHVFKFCKNPDGDVQVLAKQYSDDHDRSVSKHYYDCVRPVLVKAMNQQQMTQLLNDDFRISPLSN